MACDTARYSPVTASYQLPHLGTYHLRRLESMLMAGGLILFIAVLLNFSIWFLIIYFIHRSVS